MVNSILIHFICFEIYIKNWQGQNNEIKTLYIYYNYKALHDTHSVTNPYYYLLMFLFIHGTFKSKNILFKHSSPLTVEHKIGPNIKWPYTEGCLAGWFHGVSNKRSRGRRAVIITFTQHSLQNGRQAWVGLA